MLVCFTCFKNVLVDYSNAPDETLYILNPLKGLCNFSFLQIS